MFCTRLQADLLPAEGEGLLAGALCAVTLALLPVEALVARTLATLVRSLVVTQGTPRLLQESTD